MSRHTQEAVNNLEEYFKKNGVSLKKLTNSTITNGYRYECDASAELNEADCSYYESLIGTLRWMLKIGRVYISCEFSVISIYVAITKEGHLQQLYNTFAYLKMYHNSILFLEPMYTDIMIEYFPKNNWMEFYGEMKELLPPDAPHDLGKEFIIKAFVDVNFSGGGGGL